MASCQCDKQGNAIGCGTIAIKTGRSSLVASDKTKVTRDFPLIFVFLFFCISLQSNINFVARHELDSPGIPHPGMMMGVKGKKYCSLEYSGEVEVGSGLLLHSS